MGSGLTLRPSSEARSAETSTSAAAPSAMMEELPAVTVPPSLTNAGTRLRILSGFTFVSASSVMTGLPAAPRLPGTWTGVTSYNRKECTGEHLLLSHTMGVDVSMYSLSGLIFVSASLVMTRLDITVAAMVAATSRMKLS